MNRILQNPFPKINPLRHQTPDPNKGEENWKTLTRYLPEQIPSPNKEPP